MNIDLCLDVHVLALERDVLPSSSSTPDHTDGGTFAPPMSCRWRKNKGGTDHDRGRMGRCDSPMGEGWALCLVGGGGTGAGVAQQWREESMMRLASGGQTGKS
jgi:hypothetical protein